MMTNLRRYFITGLLLWLPLWVTLLVIRFMIDVTSNILLLLPHRFQPDVLFGVHIPLIGLITTVLVLLLTGMIAGNFLGRYLVVATNALMERIPLVNTIYKSVKQVSDTLLKPGGESFRKVLLVEYPREGLWTLAFQTGEGTPEVSQALNETEMVSLFVPTTPNPTSGFLMIAPRAKVIELKMSVDQALKFIISLGVVQPSEDKKKYKNLILK
jgi:uncharacterized membrane protein